MTVLRRMNTLPACASIVMKLAEANVQNPLGRIYKLSKIATRASKADNLVCVMQLMYDVWSNGALHNDQFAFQNLTPMGKSLVDLLVLKQDILDLLLHKCMDSRSFLEPANKTIRGVCANIGKFRKQCEYCLQYQALPRPALRFHIFVAASCQVSFQTSSQCFSAFDARVI